MSVTPRGMSIQEAYREYRDGAFKVNRKYQRKLVWSLEEKRALIDSVLRGYPIPLILLATHTLTDGTKRFEILDGMQRLEAIFSFIDNRFSTSHGAYFDTNQLARAKQLAEQNLIPTHPGSLLAARDCANVLDYTLAVTEFPAANEEAVNEVFGRINAYGRQLSSQERRQAGVLSSFATCVRELAAEIRGDVSSESLDLSEMPTISIEVGGESLGYGIRADDTFWCKQGVLQRNQLRDSEDEQMIADLAVSVLYGGPRGFSGTQLDEYYETGTESSDEVEGRLATYGQDSLKNDILTVISVIREAVEEHDPNPNALRRLVHPTAGANPVKTAFYAIFMAFFDLCIGEERSPTDTGSILRALRGVQDRLQVSAGQIRAEQRQGNVAVVRGLIQNYFDERRPPVRQTGRGLSIRFENALRRSRIETSAFECKQGLLRLDAAREEQVDLLERITQTICAIANIGPDHEGAIFIGVADSEQDANRIADLDQLTPLRVGSRFVVGVDREVPRLGISLDAYKRRIVDAIRNSPLTEPLKSEVLSSTDCIEYRGLSIICLWVRPQRSASTFGDDLYVREGSETKKVVGVSATKAALARFPVQ